MAIHAAIANGRLINPQPRTRSTLDRNLIAAASSIKPSSTLTTFIQDPLFGRDSNHCGNMAKRTKGLAKAAEKPTIPMIG